MMQRALTSLALLALAAGAFTSAAAQDRRAGRDRGLVELPQEQVRSGFYIAGVVGAGAEQNKYSDELTYTQSLTKPTLGLRLGGTPNANTRVGAEFFGWFNSVDGGTETFGTALITAQLYPVRHTGLFVKVGGGIAQAGTPSLDPFASNITETGFGWSVGAGYEIQLSRQFAVGPTVDFYKGTFTKRNQPTLSDRVLNIGVQLSYQSGGRRR
ncbi:MAG: outer membrane beta-barrel protein [Gemmatimonadota bacterium]